MKKAIQEEIHTINQKLGEHEKIRRFQLIKDDFSTKTGELSNSLKLKRQFITQKYNDFIRNLYPNNKDNKN